MLKKILLKPLIQNLFPFLLFWYFNSRAIKTVHDVDNIKLQELKSLPAKSSLEEIAKEHLRAETIDSKTSKLTLSLSISLTIISSTASGLATLLPNDLGVYVVLSLLLSSFYMLMGGVISLGALKTLPKFGYGARFQLIKCQEKYAKALLGMEKINILRHQRNECAYMCLRNGFLIITATLLSVIVYYLINLFTTHQLVYQI